jgi:hypothetical protein
MNGICSTRCIVLKFNLTFVPEQPILQSLQDITESNSLDYARASAPYRPELVAGVLEARRRKTRNKTREKRESNVARSLRALSNLSARVLLPIFWLKCLLNAAKWTKFRGGGIVALVRKRMGFKLKDPEAGVELGEKENRLLPDQATAFLRAENQ